VNEVKKKKDINDENDHNEENEVKKKKDIDDENDDKEENDK